MTLVLTLDGTDLSTKGIYASGVPSEWRSPPRLGRASHRMPGSAYGYLSPTADIPARVMRIPLRVDGNPVADLTAIRSAEDWLTTKLGSLIPLQVAAAGISTRSISGYLDHVQLTPKATWETPSSDLEIELTCADATWKATSDTSKVLSGTPAALTVGTAPIEDWVLTIVGAFTDLTLTLAGVTATWTGSWPGTYDLIIKGVGQVVDSNGDNQFDAWVGEFATLPASSITGAAAFASGAPTATLVYRLRYW